MNLLYVSSKKRWGGVSSWMLRTAKGLEARGHRVHILAHPDGKFVANTKGNKRIIAHRLGIDYNPLTIGYLAGFIKKNKVQAVVTNIEKEVIAGGMAARWCGIPNIRRVGREDDFNAKWSVKWHHRLLVNKCIVPCDHVRENALKRAPWLDESQFTTIYNGTNPTTGSWEAVIRKRREWGVPEGALVVGITSQLSPQKNVDRLVKVFGRLKKRYENIHLVITGEGREKDVLRQQVQQAHLEAGVSFSGFAVEPLKAAEAYDIAVSSSSFEGFPNTVVEYFAAGRPVVTTDAGGVTEMAIDRENAIIVPVGNDEALHDGIAALIEDETLRSKLGTNAARTIAGGFSEEHMLERLEHFFIKSIH